MKVVYVILFGLVMFNAVLIATNELNIFQHDVGGKDMDEYGESASSEDLLVGVFAGTGTIIGIIGAWVSKSPVPIGAGAFAGFCSGMWARTYILLQEMSVANAFLGLGTIAMGVVMTFAVIDIMSMQGGN